MRRWYAVAALLIVTLAGLPTLPARAALATGAEIRARVDTWLSARWQLIQDREASYFTEHGRYWQGLRTHSFELEYTAAVDATAPADLLDASPTDQPVRWSDLFPELVSVTIPAAVVIDVYDGPAGMGYSATVYIKYNGVIWSRAAQVGPEDWRAYGWKQVTQ